MPHAISHMPHMAVPGAPCHLAMQVGHQKAVVQQLDLKVAPPSLVLSLSYTCPIPQGRPTKLMHAVLGEHVSIHSLSCPSSPLMLLPSSPQNVRVISGILGLSVALDYYDLVVGASCMLALWRAPACPSCMSPLPLLHAPSSPNSSKSACPLFSHLLSCCLPRVDLIVVAATC